MKLSQDARRTAVSDPGGCGFGKISEVAVLEVEAQTR